MHENVRGSHLLVDLKIKLLWCMEIVRSRKLTLVPPISTANSIVVNELLVQAN